LPGDTSRPASWPPMPWEGRFHDALNEIFGKVQPPEFILFTKPFRTMLLAASHHPPPPGLEAQTQTNTEEVHQPMSDRTTAGIHPRGRLGKAPQDLSPLYRQKKKSMNNCRRDQRQCPGCSGALELTSWSMNTKSDRTCNQPSITPTSFCGPQYCLHRSSDVLIPKFGESFPGLGLLFLYNKDRDADISSSE
jgi:hypothetical protein